MQNSECRIQKVLSSCRSLAIFLLVASLTLPLIAQEAQDKFLGRSAEEWSGSLTSSAGQQRTHAAWAIALLAGRQAGGPSDQVHFAELVKLISDNDPAVRYWGVMGLAAFAQRKEGGGQTAVIKALQPLLEDKSPAPRIAAALALGQLNHVKEALPVLVAAMESPQESVRIQAVAALEKLGPAARPADATLRSATSDSSEYVKRISSRALATLAAEKK
jgi:HEAT repeat protein